MHCNYELACRANADELIELCRQRCSKVPRALNVRSPEDEGAQELTNEAAATSNGDPEAILREKQHKGKVPDRGRTSLVQAVVAATAAGGIHDKCKPESI